MECFQSNQNVTPRKRERERARATNRYTAYHNSNQEIEREVNFPNTAARISVARNMRTCETFRTIYTRRVNAFWSILTSSQAYFQKQIL